MVATLLLWAFCAGLSVLAFGMVRHVKTRTAEGALQDQTRRKIKKLIDNEPGICWNEVRRRLDLNTGTLEWHLDVLRRSRVVVELRLGRFVHQFGQDVPLERAKQLAVLHHARIIEVARAIISQPGLQQKEIRQLLNLTRKVIRAWADMMAEVGLIDETPVGRKKLYFPTEALLRLWPTLKHLSGCDAPELKDP